MADAKAQIQHTLLSSVVKGVLRFRVPLLLAFLMIAAFLCFQIQDIKLADPMESLYPEGHPFLPSLKAIEKMSPDPRMLIAILEVKEGDIYNGQTIAKVDRVTRRLMGMEGVLPAGITSLTRGMDHYESSWEGMKIEPILGRTWPKSPEEFEALRQRVAVSPMGLGAYVSYDGKATMITAPLADVEKQARQAFGRLPATEKEGQTLDEYVAREKKSFQKTLLKTVEDLKAAEDDESHTLYFMGPQLIEAQMTAMGLTQISIAAGCTFLVVLALLGFYFRSLQGVVVPMITMALSILLGIGLFAVTGTELNPLTALFPLVPGLFSLAYGAHAVRRCGLLFEGTSDKTRAIAAAYGDPALVCSIAAAGLATLSLTLTRVPALKSLGLFGLFWLSATLCVMFVFAPLLHSILPPFRIRRKDDSEEEAPFSDIVTAERSGSQKLVAFLILAVILAAGALSAGKLRVGDNVPGSSYLRPDHPWNQCFNLLAKKFMGPYQLLVYAKAKEPGGFLDPEALYELGRLSDYLKEACGARESISFDMMVQLARKTFLDGNPKWETVPVSRDQVVRLAGMVMEQGGVESFMDKTFTEATVSPFFPESDADHINAYTTRIQDYIQRHPSDKVEFQVGGGLLGMIKAINDGTGDAYAKALLPAFLAAFILGLLLSRSLLLSLFVVFALAGAQAVQWIGMAVTGTPVSFPLVTVAIPCIGFGTLFGYPLIRYIAEERRNPNRIPATGSSGWGERTSDALFLGLLVFAATVPWAFIGMKFQSTMVFTMGITSMLQAVFCTIFVPALASWLKPRGPDDT